MGFKETFGSFLRRFRSTNIEPAGSKRAELAPLDQTLVEGRQVMGGVPIEHGPLIDPRVEVLDGIRLATDDSKPEVVRELAGRAQKMGISEIEIEAAKRGRKSFTDNAIAPPAPEGQQSSSPEDKG